jgi:glycogen(starch) synthase
VRVLFWAELFWPSIGGCEIFAAKLLLALRERGHDFVVVTEHGPGLAAEDSYKGIPVHRLPFWTAINERNVERMIESRRRITDLKRNFAPDLVHAHSFGPSILFHLETARINSAPLLFTVQLELLPDQNSGPDTLMGRTLRAADWVTCVSSAALAQVRERVPEIVARSSVIFNSLDLPTLGSAPLPSTAPRLLCLGRLHTQKGFDVALSALATIIDRFPDIRLIVAGDGPEKAALERQVADLKLTRVVDFIGWVAPDQVPALIAAATMVIIPSRWEGLPLVALEAAQLGRPIVATRVSGLSETVLHGESGMLVEPEDVAGLAEAIAFMLAQPEAAARMGRALRTRVQKLFSWQRCVEAYDQIYRKLGNSTAAPGNAR